MQLFFRERGFMKTFKLTNEQVAKACALAVNASVPVGMGFLHYTPKEFTPSDFEVNDSDQRVDLDYVQGRMVKLFLKRNEENHEEWEVRDESPRPDYQSWCMTYPTWEDLIEAAKS
jgi:hypothetical protein